METAAVKEELQLFLNSRMSAESLSCLDDIVLGYIVNVLEQLGEDDHFDIDEFISIMDAYLPGFEQVNRDDVYSWMLLLVDKFASASDTTYSKGHDQDATADESVSGEYDWYSLKIEPKSRILHQSAGEPTKSCGNDLSMRLKDMNCKYGASPDHSNQEHLDITKESKSTSPLTSFAEKVSLLKEMFPEACTLEVRKCLLVASGDPEAAVQLMLYNKEISEENVTDVNQHTQDLTVKAHQPSSKKQQLQEKDNKCLKEQLMARYGYVDTSEEEKIHRPVLQKQEQKKLIRYRDNQVVSTKGERYSLVKQEESEDLKKTYINLKPARKYRFH